MAHDLEYERKTKGPPRASPIAFALDALVVLPALLFILFVINRDGSGVSRRALPVLYLAWLTGSTALVVSLQMGRPARERTWQWIMIVFTIASVGMHLLILLFIVAYLSV